MRARTRPGRPSKATSAAALMAAARWKGTTPEERTRAMRKHRCPALTTAERRRIERASQA